MAENNTARNVVIGMTVLLVAMLGLLAYGLVRNSRSVDAGLEKMQTAIRWDAQLPAGSIRAISSSGSTLSVWLETSSGETILVYDTRDGRQIGALTEHGKAD